MVQKKSFKLKNHSSKQVSTWLSNIADCEKSQSKQVSSWLSNIAFHLWRFWVQTLVVARACFQGFAHQWVTTIRSGCAFWLESEQKLFSLTGRQFRSAALHSIQFRTCSFVPLPYFYSDSEEQRMLAILSEVMRVVSVTSYREVHKYSWFNFTWKQIPSCDVITAQKLQSIRPFLTLKLSQYCKSGSIFSFWRKKCYHSFSFWRKKCYHSWQLPAATAAKSHRLLCLCLPSIVPNLCLSAAPRARPLILHSNPSIALK